MAARSAAGTAITFVEPQDRLDDSATTAGAEIPGSPQAVSVDEAIWQLDPLQREDGAPALAKGTAVQRTAPENVAEAVVHWLACYGQSPSEASRNIRELAAKAPEQVVDAALELYRTGGCGEGARLLASLLCGDSRTVAKLCDPGASLDGAVRVARALMQHEPLFDVLLAKSLLHDDQMTEGARQRGLAVLEKLGSSGRLIPILIQFLRDPDSRIRSKTALMFGQIMSTHGVMDRLFADEDARVRANFVEGLWRGPDGFDSRALFRQAAADSNHRVAGNALVGLHRLGETQEVIAHVSKMARRPEGLFRAAVAWVMGETGDRRYTGVLRSMVRDPDPRVRLNALRSLRRINLASSANAATESHPTGRAQASATPPDTPAALE